MKLGALQLLMHILYNFVFPQFLQRSSIWLSTQQCTNLSLQALYTTTNQLLLHKHCIINVFLTIQQACDFIWIDWIVKVGVTVHTRIESNLNVHLQILVKKSVLNCTECALVVYFKSSKCVLKNTADNVILMKYEVT